MFSNELWQKSGVSTYSIDQSIRFNDGDSPILKKTYSSAGTEETFTLSMWVKRGNIGAGLGAANLGLTLFSGGASVSNYGEIVFRSSGYGVQDSLHFYNSASGSINFQLVTTQLFRDPSAWYHIVCVMDTTNAVVSERMRIYVNGLRVTDFSTETYPSQNAVPNFNTATEHGIGGFAVSTDTRFFDGYLAEIVFLDGTATDSSSFGEYNSSGIWIPKDVSDLTFGTNGFHIDGRDSADLGDDESGNGNDFTTSGLASHDQVPDSPTNNFAVLSPIDKGSMTLSEGNLKGTSGSSSVWQTSKATIGVKSGKWYWEVRAGGTTYNLHGTVGLAQTLSTTSSIHPGVPSDGYGWYGTNGAIYHNGGQIATESTYTTGDIISFALDLDDSGGILTAYKNGVSEGNLTTTYKTADTDDFIFPAVGLLVSDTCIINFGQDGTFAGNVTAGGNSDGNGIGNFKYSVPSGFLALCTKNLGS